MKKQVLLTAEQIEMIAAKMPQVIRAALAGLSLTGLDVTLTGVKTAELCHPLNEVQLETLRGIKEPTHRVIDVTHLPEEDRPCEGLVVFRVSYDIAWYDADGNAHAVRQTGVLGLMCEVHGGGWFREMLFIREVEGFRLAEDGTAKRPGAIERWMRRKTREFRRTDKAATVGEFLLEALGAVLEAILEGVFDG